MAERKNGFYFINGDNYVSVTNVLSVLAKPALINWAAKMGARAALKDPTISEDDASYAIYQFKQSSADRGSLVHKFCEHYGTPNQIQLSDIPEEFQGFCNSYVDWYNTNKPELLYREIILCNHTHRYAGTADLYAKIGDLYYLIDLKTGKDIYDEAKLQLTAYKYAEEFRCEGKPADMNRIDKTAVLLLSPDKEFRFQDSNSDDEDFKDFLACKRLWIRQNKEKYLTRNTPIKKRTPKNG